MKLSEILCPIRRSSCDEECAWLIRDGSGNKACAVGAIAESLGGLAVVNYDIAEEEEGKDE